jgi:hypothetical protein
MNCSDVILLCFSLLGFGIFLLSVAAANSQLKESIHKAKFNSTPCTLLLPVRNEPSSVLKTLKEQLHNLNEKATCYFKVIDDGSHSPLSFNDAGLDRHILRTPPNLIGSKKKALTLGIEQASTDWIITTDADTLWNLDWLNSIRHQALPGTSMLIGPVFSQESKSLYSLLSYYESLCLWTLSAASCRLGIPILASGANLAFTKTSWQAVGGYASHIDRASGDDVLLMADIAAKFPHEIFVLKGRHAYTTVLSESNFLSWMAQHKRWISKTDHLNSPLKKGYALLLLIWLFIPLLLCLVHPLFPVLWFLMEYLWILRLTQWYRLHSQLLRWLFFRVVYPLTIPLILLSTPKAWK